MKNTTEATDQYDGMPCIITVYFHDETSKQYVHFGKRFFKESGKHWYEMPYKQAEKFENIYNDLNGK